MHAGFTPIILVHMYAAFAALLLGIAVLARRKGTPVHKLTGRLWVLLMLIVSISSFWIKGDGSFSWIHGLSVFTLFSLAGAIWFIKRGNIRAHERIMKGTFFGALVIAGLFTLLPQRLLGRVVWGALGLV